ncbi:MAG: flippase activity-associated protein Agl23 [Planctomycetota bacterium]|jgi:uncharacterized protein (TIGR03663 family)
MIRAVALAALMLAIVATAAVVRVVDLDNRPMHCDEANHAVKLGGLLEEGDYVYDPRDYHGPSLNFLSLPIARLTSAPTLAELTEIHLRVLPALFGIALVGLVWLVRHELGHGAALCAAAWTALSPSMVFYSRYYIQEMLLVGFTFLVMVALWRFRREVAVDAGGDEAASRRRPLRSAAWLVVLGLSAAMMHASKETCVIALFAMAVAAVCTMRDLKRLGTGRLLLSGLVVMLVAAGVSALFFSSFLDNPSGVIDSYTTYFHYLGQASGEGSVGPHQQWPDYYFRVLFWWHRPDGPLWTELSIGVLAAVGLAAGVVGRGLGQAGARAVRFLGIYTVVMTAVYSAMPYKTPWCALGFLHGMILLAGVGTTVLFRSAPGTLLKVVVGVLMLAAACHLGWQAYRASFVFYDDPCNPHVYAHTTRDVPRLARQVEQIVAAHPDGASTHVQVICPDHDYWPLPWYLRSLRGVKWCDGVPHVQPAPLIVTQPAVESALAKRLADQPPGEFQLYVPFAPEEMEHPWRLRPGVPMHVWVELSLWEAYQRAQGSASQRPSTR